MRYKKSFDTRLNDKDLFLGMEVGDIWVDAGMHMVWKYIYKSSKISIPDSWQFAMKQFDDEISRIVSHLHFAFRWYS